MAKVIVRLRERRARAGDRVRPRARRRSSTTASPARSSTSCSAHGVALEHACGGSCACTTCHVVVKQGTTGSRQAEESEEDLLDKAPGLTPTSRLGCQAVVARPRRRDRGRRPALHDQPDLRQPWRMSATAPARRGRRPRRRHPLALPPPAAAALAFRPGQFLSCLLPVGGERADPSLLDRVRPRRTPSASSCCSTSCPDGPGSRYLFGLAPGATRPLHRPVGHLRARPRAATPRPSSSPIGTGIAPIRPMLRRALAHGATHPLRLALRHRRSRSTATSSRRCPGSPSTIDRRPTRARGRGRAPLARRRRRPHAPLLRLRRRRDRAAPARPARAARGYARRAVQYEKW